jgi:hypothetical protein
MRCRVSEVDHLLRSCRACKLPAPRLDGLAGPSVDGIDSGFGCVVAKRSLDEGGVD